MRNIKFIFSFFFLIFFLFSHFMSDKAPISSPAITFKRSVILAPTPVLSETYSHRLHQVSLDIFGPKGKT